MKKTLIEEELDYWKNLANTKCKLIVFYGQSVLDLTSFSKIHPGSEQAIKNYRLMDVQNILYRIYPHSPSTTKTLMKFCIGKMKKIPERRKSKKKGSLISPSPKFPQKDQESRKVRFQKEEEQQIKNQIRDKESSENSFENQINGEETQDNFDEGKPEFSIPKIEIKFQKF